MPFNNCNSDDLVNISLGDHSVVIHLHGATILSWKVNGNENLFVSKKAIFDNQKGIRGGVPFVFPNFGPWKLGPQHGFARTNRWNCTEACQDSECAKAVFELCENEQTMAMWKHKFLIQYTVSLKKSGDLQMEVIVSNKNVTESFDFTFLLHTYFDIGDIDSVRIAGLKGRQYIDKNKNHEEYVDNDEELMITGPTDRVYMNTPNEQILSFGTGRRIKIVKENLPDTVVWNPWKDGFKQMGDFEEGGDRRMVCVEVGKVNEAAVLQPGTEFQAMCCLSLL